jgi:hypothetical protein
MFSALSKASTVELPDEIFPPAIKVQAMDFEFHWVSEAGKEDNKTSALTSGMNLVPTVCQVKL